MIVRQLCDQPSPELIHGLADFEAAFRYPLGPGRFFRISHGDDYPRFFRAMGEAACFLAEHQGRVVDTVGMAVRRLLLPDGMERPIRAALCLARAAGLPALFVSIAEVDAAALGAALEPLDRVVAPATVFGVGLEPGFAWNVNSSEI
jgi:hypothetical protein